MENTKKSNITGYIISLFKLATIIGFVSITVCPAFAQIKSAYFEQKNRSVISIQLEDAVSKWLFSAYDELSAGNRSLKFVQYDSLVLLPLADSYIDRNQPESNFGNDFLLAVLGKGGESRGRFLKPGEGFKKVTYLKFAIPQMNGQLIGAKLQLYALSDGFGGGVFYLNPNEDIIDWDENSITWNDRPSGRFGQGEPGTFLDYLGDVTSHHWYAFDVTNIFQYNIPYYSFAIVMREALTTSWGSKESVHPPVLKIYYIPRKTSEDITGSVSYYANNYPIPNVTINLSVDTLMQDSQTDTNGVYQFNGEKIENKYSLRPFKERFSDIPAHTILTYDAALTAQAAIGLRSLSDYQKIAADVDLDNKILFYDAALIARYSIGLPPDTNSNVAGWVFSPPDSSLTLTGESDKEKVDFKGVLLGDVHGGWHFNESLAKLPVSQLSIASVKMQGKDTLSVDFSIINNSQISSFDFSLKFDFKGLRYLSYEIGRDYSGFFLNQVVGKDEMKLNGFTAKPSFGGNKFLNIKFKLLENMNKIHVTVPYFTINNYKRSKYSFNLMNYVSGSVPEEFKMYAGYPNPFNSEILFKLDIPIFGRLAVSVYNQLGQLVRVVYNNQVEKGVQRLIWDGKNLENCIVPSGIYFVVAKYDKVLVNQKILFLR